MRDYLKFYKDFNPHVERVEDGSWEIFTLPTQWVRGFSSYEDAIHHAMDYIEAGNWKAGESSFSRFIQEIEKEEPVHRR